MSTKYGFTIGYPVDMGMHMRTQGFGVNPEKYKQYGLKGHNGDDFAPVGNYKAVAHVVKACDEGVVTVVGEEKDKKGKYIGFGVYIEVRHSWGRSLTAHLVKGSSKVVVGQKVKRGQDLAVEDSTGNSTGTHVHFQIKPEGEPYANGFKGAVDPRPYYGTLTLPLANEPGQASPSEGEGMIGEGVVRVTADHGLRIRLQPVMDGNFYGFLPFGTMVEALGEVVEYEAVDYRAVKLWIAESEGGVMYLEGVK